MPRRRKRWRRVPEGLMALLGRLVVPLLPRRAVVLLARGLGAAAWRCSPSLRRISDANLRLVFGDALSPARRAEIGRASFQSFALTTLDVFWFMRRTAPRLRRYVRLDESFLPMIQDPPLIGITGHIGNWEVISMACGVHGAPVTAAAMPLQNPFADRLLNRARRRTGSEAVPRAGALRGLLKALKAGRTAALVLDQNTLPSEGGVFLPFFGVPAPVSRAAGMLWQRTGLRLIAAACTADRGGVYTVVAGPLFPAAGEEPSAEEITLRAVRELETLIRRHPEHWLWSYKRWRWRREEDPAERYPFYAQMLRE